jgi:hypothetical protein
MDLSKVTLPTFILEPRSFLEKLADYYFHADLLATYAPFLPAFPALLMLRRLCLRPTSRAGLTGTCPFHAGRRGRSSLCSG